MHNQEKILRVAFIAGTLSQGGAEKQLVYMVRALRESGISVQVYCLSQGEFYESVLRELGLVPVWVGKSSNPILRLLRLVRELRMFKPTIVQSAHTYTNLYAGLVGRFLNIVSVGALRTNLGHTQAANGAWTRWHMRIPSVMTVNAKTALEELVTNRLVTRRRVFLIPNVIDLCQYKYNSVSARHKSSARGNIIVIFVARLVPAKRLDRFMQALGLARRKQQNLKGVVIGDGPERQKWESKVTGFGLTKEDICFLGTRSDVVDQLGVADMLVSSSDEEGFPNVLLEAMAAGLPIVTTPAGDAPSLVHDGINGYVVPFDDPMAMADRIVKLAQSLELRRKLGAAGRQEVQSSYSFERLACRLFSVYRSIGEELHNGQLLGMVPVQAGTVVTD